MKRSLFLFTLFFILLGSSETLAQIYRLPETTVAALPAAASVARASFIVIDGADEEDCTVGGGAARVLCNSDGTTWVPLGDGGTGGGGGGATTEAELESDLTDVLDVFTNNDGALNDDDVTLADVQAATTSDFHNIGGVDDDQPDDDSEVPDDITVDNTTNVETDGNVIVGGDILFGAGSHGGVYPRLDGFKSFGNPGFNLNMGVTDSSFVFDMNKLRIPIGATLNFRTPFNIMTLAPSAGLSDVTLTLPDEDGTLCSTGSVCYTGTALKTAIGPYTGIGTTGLVPDPGGISTNRVLFDGGSWGTVNFSTMGGDTFAALNSTITDENVVAASDVVPQAEAEAGTATTARIWTAQRVAQAIAALESDATPGGSDTEIQYNNAGAFGGIASWTTDGTTVTGSAATTTADALVIKTTDDNATNNILDLQNNAGASHVYVDGSGDLYFNQASARIFRAPVNFAYALFGPANQVGFQQHSASGYDRMTFGSGFGHTHLLNTQDTSGVLIQKGPTPDLPASARLHVKQTTLNQPGLVVQSTDDNATNNLQEWLDSAGTTKSYINTTPDGVVPANSTGFYNRVDGKLLQHYVDGNPNAVHTLQWGATGFRSGSNHSVGLSMTDNDLAGFSIIKRNPTFADGSGDELGVTSFFHSNGPISFKGTGSTNRHTRINNSGLWSFGFNSDPSARVEIRDATATRLALAVRSTDDNSTNPIVAHHLADGTTPVWQTYANGNLVVGAAALATTATDGFLYITSAAGTPTGVATTHTGRVPLVYDTANNLLYAYNAGWQIVEGSHFAPTDFDTDYGAETVTSAWTLQNVVNFDSGTEGTLRLPTSTTLPGTCTVGDTYWDTDADTDGSLYVCRTANTWKEVDDDGGAGGSAFSDITSGTNTTATMTLGAGSSFILEDANGAAPTSDGQIKFDRTSERIEVGDGAGTNEFYAGAHTTDTGPAPDCAGTSTYQDGEGGCDAVGGDISGGLDAVQVDDVQSATANTEAADNNTTQVATTAFVQQEINGAGGTGLTCSAGTCNVDLGTNVDLASAEVTGTLPVGNGGTGATTLTDGGILLGSGAGAITALGVATNGQIPIGDGTTDPVLGTISGTAGEIDITNGAGTIQVGIVTNPTLGGANITGVDISAGTNLTAGRSLTLTGDDVAADAELYTDEECVYLEDPVTDEILATIWRAPVALTITEIYCEATGGTSVAADFDNDDGTPTGVNGAEITCTTSGVTDSAMGGDAAMSAGDRLDLNLGTVTGSVDALSICFLYTKDD